MRLWFVYRIITSFIQQTITSVNYQVDHSYRCSKLGVGGLNYFKQTLNAQQKKNTTVGDVAQLAEGLPSVCRALGLILSMAQTECGGTRV